LDAAGSLLGLPVQYRDGRTDGIMERVFDVLPAEDLYRATGNQFMFYNTVFQLVAEIERNPARIKAADQLLLMPDLLNFWLTGVRAQEATNCSTMQLLNAATGQWAVEVMDALGIPRRLFKDLVTPGTVVGNLLPEIAEATGMQAKVVAVGSHDTASAYAGTPVDSSDSVILSSGTWSLLGTLSPEPLINQESFENAFTNERAEDGSIRLLKPICGMWLMQECKRCWEEAGEVSWVTLVQEAMESEPLVSFIDPDDPRLAKPCDMPNRLKEVCRSLDQPVPQSRGAMSRMIFESLAFKYRTVTDSLQDLLGRPLGTFHVVGGGGLNQLLNQFTANALNRRVITGPVEATAAGNILSQMKADGKVTSTTEGTALIRNSFSVDTYEPNAAEDWEQAYPRFQAILNG